MDLAARLRLATRELMNLAARLRLATRETGFGSFKWEAEIHS
jgi:hypothetical protein